MASRRLEGTFNPKSRRLFEYEPKIIKTDIVRKNGEWIYAQNILNLNLSKGQYIINYGKLLDE